ncbi:MAG: hypothetical protein ACTSX3_05390, partial [Candidatus Thorarchaeota archaeon]
MMSKPPSPSENTSGKTESQSRAGVAEDSKRWPFDLPRMAPMRLFPVANRSLRFGSGREGGQPRSNHNLN